MVRKFLDAAFWIAISLYFGGMVMLAVSAPAVFATVQSKDNPIVMTTATSPALDPSLQAGGEIFGAILLRFQIVEFAALTVLGLVIALWMFKVRLPVIGNWLLAMGWAILAALLVYNAVWLTPAVIRARDDQRRTAPQHLDSNAAWPEKDTFDSRHAQSTALAEFKLVILLGMVCIAAWRNSSAKPRPRPPAPPPAPAPAPTPVVTRKP